EADRLGDAGAREALHAEADVRVRLGTVRSRMQWRRRAGARDPLDDLLVGDVGDVGGDDLSAVTQHGEAIGEREDLVEAVGHVDIAGSALLGLAQRARQPGDLWAREARA